MMREILFRGIPKTETNYHLLSSIWKKQSKNGWVYGSLIIAKDKYYICVSALCRVNSFVNNGITSMVEVIPETVGQYTGLTDKSGKKIFEGDIVKTQERYDRPYSKNRKSKRHIGVVEYQIHSGSGFYNSKTGKWDRYMEYAAEWIVKVQDYGKFTYGSWGDFWDCEVIGNIHDNLELMRGEEEAPKS